MSSVKSAIKALKKYSNAEPDLIEQLTQREEARHDGSDRAAAIFTGIEVDEATRRTLLGWLRITKSKDHDDEDGLFGPMKPLASFSARIRLLYALRIVGEETRDDLNIIREIRNAFAHSGRELTFETKEVKTACACLRARFWDLPSLASEKGRHESEARFHYRVAAKHIIFRLQLIEAPEPLAMALP